MDDNFLIHIEIAGKRYPLTIRREEEEQIRAAAVQVNRILFQYRQHFGDESAVDTTDLLAMVAFHLAYRNHFLEEANDTAPFVEKVSEINGLINNYLKGR